MAEKKKQPEFVVTDRRKFTDTGELRQDVARPEAEASASVSQPAPAASPAAGEVPPQKQPPRPEFSAPSEAEQKAQQEDYRQGSKRLDGFLKEKNARPADFEMTFEKLVASLYMTAMMQLGLMVPEGEEPRADILGARQTIDTLGVLNEKTEGNLTSAEQNLLQQSMFELRMAFLELTNALTRAPQPGGTPAPGGKSSSGKK